MKQKQPLCWIRPKRVSNLNFPKHSFRKVSLGILLLSSITFKGLSQELELSAASGPLVFGPTTAAYTATLLQNTSGSTFAPASPSITVTFSLDNQQRYYIGGGINRPSTTFGGGNQQGPVQNNNGFATANIPAPSSFKVFARLSEFYTSPTAYPIHSEDFTSDPFGTPGTGLNVNDNYAVEVFSSVAPLIGTQPSYPINGYYQMADLNITFNQPVNDPVLHISDLGAAWAPLAAFGAQLQLVSPATSLTLLSKHGSNLTGGAYNNLPTIYNGASSPQAGHGPSGSVGSVRVNGQNITQLKFRIYIHGGNTTIPYASSWANDLGKNAGDAFLVSVSLASSRQKISGYVWNDNTPADGNVNGNTGISVLNSAQLYAYAFGSDGKVIAKTAVGNGSATNGYYELSVPTGQSISVSISTANVNVGDNAPSSLPSGWHNTGEKAGNTQSNGNDGTANGVLSLGTVNSDLANADFSIATNVPPTAVNDASPVSTPGTAVTINPLTNDSDPDGSLNPASVSLVPPSGATNVITDPQGEVTGFTIPGQGVWTVDPTTGAVTFTPQTGFTGNPTPVSYTVKDNDGSTSNTATITVSYAPAVNQPPVAQNDQSTGNTPGTAVTINPLTNDSDPDGSLNPASVSLVPPSGATNVITDPQGEVTGFTIPGQGAWTVNPTTGVVTFTPQTGFTGNPTPISYTVKDNGGSTSNTATITVSYAQAADLITGTVFNDQNGLSDGNINGTATGLPNMWVYLYGGSTILGSAKVQPDGTYSIIKPATVGNYTLQLKSANSGFATTVPAGWNVVGEDCCDGVGSDGTPNGALSITVTSGSGITNANFGISAPATNQPPVAQNDQSTGNTPGTAVTINPLTNDSDPNGSLNPASVSLVPPSGATSVITDPQGEVTGFTIPGQGDWTVNPTTGAVTFTPQSGFTGNPTPVSYTVKDNDGNTSNTATITVSYTPAADLITGTVFNDLNGLSDGNINGSATGLPNMWVYLYGGSTIMGSAKVQPDGTYSIIKPATAGNYTLQLKSANSGFATTVPAGWNVVGEDCCDGVGSDGTPNGVLSITVTSGSGITNANLGIRAQAANQPPIAQNDQSTGNTPGSAVVVNPLSNDTDPDGTINPATVSLIPPSGSGVTTVTDAQGDVISVTVPGEGVWTVNPTTGAVTFTPQSGFIDNPVPIQYRVSDNNGATSNSATVTITFSTPNLSPTISFRPSIITGAQTIGVIVSVFEFNTVATNGTISLYIPKDSKYTLNYNPAATNVAGVQVQNNNWSFDASTNPGFYILTSNTVIPAEGMSRFGFTTFFNPGGQRGTSTITVIILDNSGGEKTTDNTDNTNNDILQYTY